MSSILTISHCFRLGNQFPHTSQGILLTLGISFVENNHCNMMHLTPSDAESRQDVETVFRADALTQSELTRGICSADGRDGTESYVCAVREPVYPIQFTEIGGAAVNVHSRAEIRIFGGILWKEELHQIRHVREGEYFGTLDLEEGLLDGFKLSISHIFRTLQSTPFFRDWVHKHNHNTTTDTSPSTTSPSSYPIHP